MAQSITRRAALTATLHPARNQRTGPAECVQAAALSEAATERRPEEIHWIVSNGIKMSGMPAFGSHHSAEEIVALTAFVNARPGFTAEGYAALTSWKSPPAGR